MAYQPTRLVSFGGGGSSPSLSVSSAVKGAFTPMDGMTSLVGAERGRCLPGDRSAEGDVAADPPSAGPPDASAEGAAATVREACGPWASSGGSSPPPISVVASSRPAPPQKTAVMTERTLRLVGDVRSGSTGGGALTGIGGTTSFGHGGGHVRGRTQEGASGAVVALGAPGTAPAAMTPGMAQAMSPETFLRRSA